MEKPTKVGELEVNQDLAYTRRTWVAQRIGWAVVAVLLVIGLAGGFGHGPVAHATAEHPDGAFAVDYERIMRHKTEYVTVVRLGREVTTKETSQIWFSQGYLEKNQITNIEPEPARTQVGDDRVVYTFEHLAAGEPARVTFVVKSDGYGLHSGRIGLMGGPEVAIDQLIMP